MDVEEGVGAKLFGDADLALPGAGSGFAAELEVLGTDADGMCVVLCGFGAINEVHLGGTDKAGHEAVGGLFVEVER